MFEKAIKNYLEEKGYNKINLKAVLFDMDGVLFDSMKNHAKAWNKAMSIYGMNLSEEEAFMHEGRTGASTINIVCTRERGYNASEEEIKKIYQTKSEIFNSLPKAEPMPGAYTLLRNIKDSGLQPVLVTGSGQLSLLDNLNHHFPGIFQKEFMVTAFDVKYGKPNPEPYLMGLKKAGIEANEAIVVENAPLGVKAGVAAGIFTIAVNTGPLPDSALLDEGANLLFGSMLELSEKWDSVKNEMCR
ncbi:HAD-IA family hydrolase [Bacteroides caecigallinarum]|uniref:HAD-IA family hydrolase n=1 Tax=Bacteroides caecigallinarum TaxID=1411144 RepID=UPI00195E6B5F|nr:HAD-IA family hydrolase [Bacteroides caecigallinarum]MBM6889017.1 HAD-IA family hydrolase [Bacteroides caecigallinarum]MCF2550800.1 HAD-IA family hydrolase [Bacteroides caecigallinarum]